VRAFGFPRLLLLLLFVRWTDGGACRILSEEGLASCATESATIVTPTGDSFTGLVPARKVCAVSIIRAGDSLLQSILTCDPSVAVGTCRVQVARRLDACARS